MYPQLSCVVDLWEMYPQLCDVNYLWGIYRQLSCVADLWVVILWYCTRIEHMLSCESPGSDFVLFPWFEPFSLEMNRHLFLRCCFNFDFSSVILCYFTSNLPIFCGIALHKHYQCLFCVAVLLKIHMRLLCLICFGWGSFTKTIYPQLSCRNLAHLFYIILLENYV